MVTSDGTEARLASALDAHAPDDGHRLPSSLRPAASELRLVRSESCPTETYGVQGVCSEGLLHHFGVSLIFRSFAAICDRGDVEYQCVGNCEVPARCSRCGSRVLTACDACKKPIPTCYTRRPDHCVGCGSAYPWTTAAREEVLKTLALQAEVEEWDDARKERTQEFFDEVADGSISAERVEATITWFGQRFGEAAKSTLWGIVRAVGTEGVKSVLRAHGFPIP